MSSGGEAKAIKKYIKEHEHQVRLPTSVSV